MRVVFDTNVLVAALVFERGVAAKALNRIVEERDTLVLSKPIVEETVEVLGRKFRRDDDELARVALFLAGISNVIAPELVLSVLGDEPDNRILECAVVGRADAIVTGDKAMLALRAYESIDVLTLSRYVAQL